MKEDIQKEESKKEESKKEESKKEESKKEEIKETSNKYTLEKNKELEQNRVTISHDKLEAYVRISPPFDGGELTEKYILELLHEHKVIVGIDYQAIKNLISNKSYFTDILIARGEPAKDGEDGYFEFLFNINLDKKPKILADGSVDYRTLDIIECVSEGEEIVKYHPAIQGRNGIDVSGATLFSKSGRELARLKGKGFRVSEDNKVYSAEISGKIDFLKNKIIITNLFEIAGDIDVSTGDISFDGDIIIKGNIDAGMTVKTTGSITVNGYVESANLFAGKDVILKNGMQGGGRGSIESGGNVSGKFFEQVNIKAKGNINANSIMNCTIDSGEEVIVSGKLGIIVGGTTSALRGIRATIIGNMSEVKTILKVGVPIDLYTDFIKLEYQMKEMVEFINKLEDAIYKITEYIQINTLDASLPQKKIQLLRLKISKNSELADATRKRDEIILSLQKSSNAKVVITKTIYPRTKVIINGLILYVSQEWTNITLKCDGTEIRIYENEN